MGAAHDDRDAHAADFVGDGVSPGRRGRDRRDADEVGRGDVVEIELPEILDIDFDLPAAAFIIVPRMSVPSRGRGNWEKI